MKSSKLGAITFRSRSAKVIYLLKHTTRLTLTEIAQKCKVSVPCVSQLASAHNLR